MTDKEKAIVMAYTGTAMLVGDKFDIFHQYIEEKMGRPIWTHELASKKVWEEIKEATREDFTRLCRETSSEVIPVEWLKNKIDETENKLFELTNDKAKSHSLDEIFAFKDLDLYDYTLKKIYYDYTGEYYEGNHYMLREKENEIDN